MPNENNKELLSEIWRGQNKSISDRSYGGANYGGAHPQFSPPFRVPFEVSVHKIFVELEELLLSKHQRYGPKNISGAPGGPQNGLKVRMWDKLARLNNLLENPEVDAGDESLTDTLKDLANYSVIFMLVKRGQWPE